MTKKAPARKGAGKTEAAAGGKRARAKRSDVGRKSGPKVAKKGGAKQARREAALRAGATAAVLDRLFDVVTSRRDADPAISHSARLLGRGTNKVAQKFGEEAVECLIEAVAGNIDQLIGESADVLYHLIVLWVDAGLHPEQVWTELERREGMSGIAEKASRPRPAAEPPRALAPAMSNVEDD